jgi:regulatory associated protein of mTOR
MTALAVQQNVQHPAPYNRHTIPTSSSKTNSIAHQSRHRNINGTQEDENTLPVIAYGSSNTMPSAAGLNGSSSLAGDLVTASRNAADAVNNDSGKRPSSAPGNKDNLVAVAERAERRDLERVKRPVKPLLLRSRSEHGLRPDDVEHAEDDMYALGARHGFEDHYQSEDIISQLANVSLGLLLFPVSLNTLCTFLSD